MAPRGKRGCCWQKEAWGSTRLTGSRPREDGVWILAHRAHSGHLCGRDCLCGGLIFPTVPLACTLGVPSPPEGGHAGRGLPLLKAPEQQVLVWEVEVGEPRP